MYINIFFVFNCIKVCIIEPFSQGTNNNQHLTLITLRTNPAQVFHGCASTVEESHDTASSLALTKLAQSAPDEESAEELTPPVKGASTFPSIR